MSVRRQQSQTTLDMCHIFWIWFTFFSGQLIYLLPVQKAPTRKEVFDSMLEFGIFEAREKEELRRAVFVSDKSDLIGSKSKGFSYSMIFLIRGLVDLLSFILCWANNYMIWASLTWLKFVIRRLELISTTAPTTSKNETHFKSGQNWIKNNDLALLV